MSEQTQTPEPQDPEGTSSVIAAEQAEHAGDRAPRTAEDASADVDRSGAGVRTGRGEADHGGQREGEPEQQRGRGHPGRPGGREGEAEQHGHR